MSSRAIPQPRMGVYRITHQATGRTFLGYSVHVDAMLNRTRFELQHGLHRLKAMQTDWDEGGGQEAFTFEVLDELKPVSATSRPQDDLKELLSLWQEKLNIPAERRY